MSSAPWSIAASADSTRPGRSIRRFLEQTRDESLSTNVFWVDRRRARGPRPDPRPGAGPVRDQHLPHGGRSLLSPEFQRRAGQAAGRDLHERGSPRRRPAGPARFHQVRRFRLFLQPGIYAADEAAGPSPPSGTSWPSWASRPMPSRSTARRSRPTARSRPAARTTSANREGLAQQMPRGPERASSTA